MVTRTGHEYCSGTKTNPVAAKWFSTCDPRLRHDTVPSVDLERLHGPATLVPGSLTERWARDLRAGRR